MICFSTLLGKDVFVILFLELTVTFENIHQKFRPPYLHQLKKVKL